MSWLLRWVRSQWRWLLAFAMSMISQGVLMRFVEPTIPTWALAVWAVAYASSVMWLHESSVLDGQRAARRECTEWCYPEEWCEHCKRAEFGDPWDTIDTLAAEVEVLRAQVERVRDVLGDVGK